MELASSSYVLNPLIVETTIPSEVPSEPKFKFIYMLGFSLIILVAMYKYYEMYGHTIPANADTNLTIQCAIDKISSEKS